jgi:cbb3-type cytochrome oxidase subunit 3
MLPFIGIDDGLSGWGWVAMSGFFIAFIAFNLWRRGKSGD